MIKEVVKKLTAKKPKAEVVKEKVAIIDSIVCTNCDNSGKVCSECKHGIAVE